MKTSLRLAGALALCAVATAAVASSGSPQVCLAPSEFPGLGGLVADLGGRLACLLQGLISA